MFGDALFTHLPYKDYTVLLSATFFLLLGFTLNLLACCCGCLSKQSPRDLLAEESDSSLVSHGSANIEAPSSVGINGTPSQNSFSNRGAQNLNDLTEIRSYSQQPGVYGQGDEYVDMDYIKRRKAPKAVGKRPKKGLVKTEYSSTKGCWTFFGIFFSWLGWLSYGLMFLGVSGFGYMPSYVSGILIFVLLTSKCWREIYKMCPLVYRNRKIFRTGCCSLRPIIKRAKIFGVVYSHNKCLITFQILSIIALSVLLPMITTGSCLCFYNQGWGIPLLGGVWNYNSALIRKWTVGEVCPEGKICHVYVTVPEDALTSAFVNIHTGVDITSLDVSYVAAEENPGDKVTAQVESMVIKGLENLGRRNIFTAYLEGLTSNTKYTLTINYGATGNTLTKTYKTPPNGTDKELVLAIGGDVGNTETADKMTSLATKSFKPDAFYIGGNLAYDNNIRDCYYAYDKSISRFEASFDQLGYMVPIVLAIGNHDIGLNPQSSNEVPGGSTGPLHTIYFPQHLSFDTEKKIPSLEERRTYHYHTIGEMIFAVMDTGYAIPIQNQTTWIDATLKNYGSYAKFVGYHDPIFTPCTKDKNAQTIGFANWAPLFDKYKLLAAFESRTDVLKKTFPLRNNVPTENGTFYLGEGAWGAEPVSGCVGSKIQNVTGVFEEVHISNHIWIMVLDKTKNQVQYTAYSQNGDASIATFTQDLSLYIV